MQSTTSRRSLLKFASFMFPVATLGLPRKLFALDGAGAGAEGLTLPMTDLFPTQFPELVREMVLVSHFDLKRVKELVSARPSLARAAWDWGFGDWEDGLGAASHVGNRPIAEYLISMGARPSLFSATMLGQLDVVKAFVAAQPGVQRIRGPHSISLLAHAKNGGAAARSVFDYLQSLGDADADPFIPLAENDISLLVGTYIFGSSPNQQIDVSADKGLLTWTRKGTFGRGLIHLGNRIFHPIGADAVRIGFVEDNGAVVMTINDPDVVLTARKKAVAK